MTHAPQPSLASAAKLAVVTLAAAATIAAMARPAASASPKFFLANLNAAQETPPAASGSTGNALLTFNETTDILCYSIAFTGLSSAEILAHIHGPALPGTPAGILFPLPLGNPKSGCVGPLTSDQRKDLLKNLDYINIHTSAFPGGEIRGQILRIK